MAFYDGARLERVRASKQFSDGRFRNPSGATPALKDPPSGIVGEFLFGGRRRRPRGALPLNRPLDAWAKPAALGDLRTTWLGHSTVLLESAGVRVLTDPVFGPRASPVSFAGPRRFHEVPATIDELPPLDAVVLSHDHFDHLCRASVLALARRGVPIVTSLGVGARLESFGVPASGIVELDWHETHVFPGGRLALTAAPSQHFSGRSLLDRNATLWSSFVVRTDRHRVFFSGDTGLTDAFVDVGRRYGPFDLTLLEIGAFHPSWGDIHLGPENALRAFQMLGGGTLFPVHWGTFDLGLHPWAEPGEELVRLAAAEGARVVTPELGRVVVPAQLEGPTRWWRGVDAQEGVLAPVEG